MGFWIELQTIGAAWASAIATTGATGTALWLALSDRRRRQAEQQDAIKLIATGVAIYLEELRLELTTAIASIAKGLSLGNSEDLAKFLAVVAKNVNSLNTSVLTGQELNVLTQLPENAGEKIYAALACIRSVQDGFGRRLSIVSDGHAEYEVMVNYWTTQLVWAHELIEQSQEVCSRYGTLRIIQPRK